jgi:hypothetical protein
MASDTLPRSGALRPGIGDDPYGADLRAGLASLDRALTGYRTRSTGLVGDDNGAQLNADYAAVVAAGGDRLILGPGIHRYSVDLVWNSNLVSVIGPGSGICTLQAIGTAKIIARPSTFTVTQGPRFAGFTVKGDAAAPAGAKGIYSGDIVGAEFDDIVFSGFSGAGSIGLHLDNVTNWTELNKFHRVRSYACAIGVRCSKSASSSNSFARNDWDLHLDLGVSQIGFQATDNVLLYGQKGHFDGNANGNNGIFVDMAGTSVFSGKVDCDFEQTTGTGAVGVREASAGQQFLPNGVRNYAGTMPEDQGGGSDLQTMHGRRIRGLGQPNARAGTATLVGGTVTVSTTAVKAIGGNQLILLDRQLGGGTRGELEPGTRVAGTSFVINSVNSAGALVADTSVVGWEIVERY